MEHPIIFSGPMVKAILEGRKTQTRRIVKPQPHQISATYGDIEESEQYPGEWFQWCNGGDKCPSFTCPYGMPGDRLWVRESYMPHCGQPSQPGLPCGRYSADAEWFYAPDKGQKHPGSYLVRGRLVPPTHMPRWASRITLEITDVRVQRVQEISEEDAKAEGIEEGNTWPYMFKPAFSRLWDEINGHKSPWISNAWVWAITFRRAE